MECPKGSYCPRASYAATPCPAGRYTKRLGGAASTSCLPCQVGRYNDLPGQPGCKACGPSATTSAAGGARTCTCRGAHRRFIKSTGSCLCEAGYKPKNGADASADSASGCELLVKAACAAGVQVDVEGNCVTDPAAACRKQCGARGGSLVEGTGLCQCTVVQDPETVCDANCRKSQVTASLSADGKLELVDARNVGNGGKAETKKAFDPTLVSGFGGSPTCTSAKTCKLVSVGKASDGSFTAGYGTNPLLAAKGGIKASAGGAGAGGRSLQTGRGLQAAASSAASPNNTIRNPVICVNVGSVVLFEVNPAERRYPVYLKDSILNTN